MWRWYIAYTRDKIKILYRPYLATWDKSDQMEFVSILHRIQLTEYDTIQKADTVKAWKHGTFWGLYCVSKENPWPQVIAMWPVNSTNINIATIENLNTIISLKTLKIWPNHGKSLLLWQHSSGTNLEIVKIQIYREVTPIVTTVSCILVFINIIKAWSPLYIHITFICNKLVLLEL